jgi:hypothetical protein
MTSLRKVHLAIGLLGVALFLLSGAYMKFAAHPETLPDRAHLMMVSRHTYCLASALVHLSLAAYATPFPTRAMRTTQWVGSTMLGMSTTLLIAAFIVEGMGQRPRTFVSTYGLYLLFAGVLLHFLPAMWKERRR